MAFPINGATATISSVTASTDLKYLTDILKISEMTFNVDSDEFDVSELSGSGAAAEYITGLRSATMDFAGLWPKSAPRIGNVGLVTISGYTNFVTDYRIDVDFGEQEITAFAATAPTVKAYMPSGLFSWGGSFNAHAIDDDPITLTHDAASSGTAATFILSNEATNDSKLSGNVLVTRMGHAIRKADKQVLAYSFRGNGALTETAGDTYDPLRLAPGVSAGTATAWGAPSFSYAADTPSIVFNSYVGGETRAYTATGFLKSVSIECNVGQPIRVSGQIRVSKVFSNT